MMRDMKESYTKDQILYALAMLPVKMDIELEPVSLVFFLQLVDSFKELLLESETADLTDFTITKESPDDWDWKELEQ